MNEQTHPPSDPLRRWLEAELAGETSDARPSDPGDLAFAELYRELEAGAGLDGYAAPPRGFADRVALRIAAEVPAPAWHGAARAAQAAPTAPTAAAEPGGRQGWLRRLPAAGLLTAAALSVLVSLPWLPVAIHLIFHQASLASLLKAGIGSAIDAGQWAATLATLGNKLLLLIQVFAGPLATPPIAFLALVCLLVSVLALRCLHDVIQRDRRWVYADPI
jgi:hypothetical protein